MTEKPAAEEYVYHIGKIRFIVTPVYKETGELMRDIICASFSVAPTG